MATSGTCHCSGSSDVLSVNVGGTLFATTKDTLLASSSAATTSPGDGGEQQQVPNYFHGLLSFQQYGLHHQQHNGDDDAGHHRCCCGASAVLTIDRSPELFRHILHFLRYGVFLFLTPEENKLAFQFAVFDEMEYYGFGVPCNRLTASWYWERTRRREVEAALRQLGWLPEGTMFIPQDAQQQPLQGEVEENVASSGGQGVPAVDPKPHDDLQSVSSTANIGFDLFYSVDAVVNRELFQPERLVECRARGEGKVSSPLSLTPNSPLGASSTGTTCASVGSAGGGQQSIFESFVEDLTTASGGDGDGIGCQLGYRLLLAPSLESIMAVMSDKLAFPGANAPSGGGSWSASPFPTSLWPNAKFDIGYALTDCIKDDHLYQLVLQAVELSMGDVISFGMLPLKECSPIAFGRVNALLEHCYLRSHPNVYHIRRGGSSSVEERNTGQQQYIPRLSFRRLAVHGPGRSQHGEPRSSWLGDTAVNVATTHSRRTGGTGPSSPRVSNNNDIVITVLCFESLPSTSTAPPSF